MAKLDLKFDDQVRTLGVSGDLSAGWQETKNGHGFLGRGSLDFKNATRLNVNLQVYPPNRFGRDMKDFPKDVPPQRNGPDSLCYEFDGRTLTVRADLESNLKDASGKLAVLQPSGKPGFNYQFPWPIEYGRVKFHVNLLVVMNSPFPPLAGVTREYDVLPFLPGGQWESNRRRH